MKHSETVMIAVLTMIMFIAGGVAGAQVVNIGKDAPPVVRKTASVTRTLEVSAATIRIDGKEASGYFLVQTSDTPQGTSFSTLLKTNCAQPRPYYLEETGSMGWACWEADRGGHWILNGLPPTSKSDTAVYYGSSESTALCTVKRPLTSR